MSGMVLVQRDGPVAVLTLNRPGRHNSLVPELLSELLDRLAALREEPELRALVLRAEGRSFSTGGDLGAFYANREQLQTYSEHLVHLLNEAILALLEFPVPVVAAVHGIVTGGSLGLVLAADVVLVAPEASFTPYYPVVGFSPDGGWTALLPSIIGPRRAAEALLRNQSITAQQAVDWGMANRVVPADRIQAEALAVAAEIAAMKPGTIRRTMRLLRQPSLEEFGRRLQEEQSQFCQQVTTEEARKGVAAFLGIAVSD